jgi:nucleoside-diphosphate-sugar epimerase
VNVRDICQAIRYAVDFDYASDKPLILNVGDTRDNYQIIDIAGMIQKEVPGCEIRFLRSVKDAAADVELVRDRKVQDGVDTRTYKVSFERIKSVFPGFQCDWTVPDGIHEMVDFFRELPLTGAQLNNMNYYRLQKMEYLLKNGYVSEDLKWKERK